MLEFDSDEALHAGETVSLEEVLRHREKRVEFQKTIMELYPDKILIVLKANIPGPIKNNQLIAALIDLGIKQIQETLQKASIRIVYEKRISLKSGHDYFLVTGSSDGKKIKEITTAIEDQWDLGRIFDYDVYDRTAVISRDTLGLPPRKCLLCDHDAKECGRNRTHSVEELKKWIIRLIQEEGSVVFK